MSRLSSTRKQGKFVGVFSPEEVLSFSREDETRSSTKGCGTSRLGTQRFSRIESKSIPRIASNLENSPVTGKCSSTKNRMRKTTLRLDRKTKNFAEDVSSSQRFCFFREAVVCSPIKTGCVTSRLGTQRFSGNESKSIPRIASIFEIAQCLGSAAQLTGCVEPLKDTQ